MQEMTDEEDPLTTKAGVKRVRESLEDKTREDFESFAKKNIRVGMMELKDEEIRKMAEEAGFNIIREAWWKENIPFFRRFIELLREKNRPSWW